MCADDQRTSTPAAAVARPQGHASAAGRGRRLLPAPDSGPLLPSTPPAARAPPAARRPADQPRAPPAARPAAAPGPLRRPCTQSRSPPTLRPPNCCGRPPTSAGPAQRPHPPAGRDRRGASCSVKPAAPRGPRPPPPLLRRRAACAAAPLLCAAPLRAAARPRAAARARSSSHGAAERAGQAGGAERPQLHKQPRRGAALSGAQAAGAGVRPAGPPLQQARP
jgi:hypothetical protein